MSYSVRSVSPHADSYQDLKRDHLPALYVKSLLQPPAVSRTGQRQTLLNVPSDEQEKKHLTSELPDSRRFPSNLPAPPDYSHDSRIAAYRRAQQLKTKGEERPFPSVDIYV